MPGVDKDDQGNLSRQMGQRKGSDRGAILKAQQGKPASGYNSKMQLPRVLGWELPCGPVVKNLPCSAQDTGSVPDWGTKIPHAAEQLTQVPQLLSQHRATKDPS